MTLDIATIKTALTGATDDQKRALHQHLKQTLSADQTDNTTCVGFRATRSDKRLLYSIAERANTTVSAICRTAIHTALRDSFGSS